MSLTVLLIAAAHGVPVVAASAFIGKGCAVFAAAVMAMVALFMGGAQYLMYDLNAVGGALWFSLSR
jgi:hypothetical protein